MKMAGKVTSASAPTTSNKEEQMKVNKEQFKEFLIGLGFEQCTGFNDDVMYSDLFGNIWVYFTGAKEETSNETYCIVNVAYKSKIDLSQFVLDALEAKEKQTWEIIGGR